MPTGHEVLPAEEPLKSGAAGASGTAGAGGAAHLPGMVASITTLPVIGVPIKSSNSIDGWDSVLSILQMPNGVPVATVALNAAKNAGILATEIIGCFDEAISKKISDYVKEHVQLTAFLNDDAKEGDIQALERFCQVAPQHVVDAVLYYIEADNLREVVKAVP